MRWSAAALLTCVISCSLCFGGLARAVKRTGIQQQQCSNTREEYLNYCCSNSKRGFSRQQQDLPRVYEHT